jgi:hypothetical protein
MSSLFTRQNVAMLRRTDEFDRLQQVKDQRGAFSTMWAAGLICLGVLLYADFMVSMTTRSFPVVGAVARACDPPHLLLPLLAFVVLAAAWAACAVWADVFEQRENLWRVMYAHLLTAAAFALVPQLPAMAPFTFKLDLHRPWLAAVPMAPFLVGYLLFHRRFGGFWKGIALTRSPYLLYAPRFGWVLLAVWFLAGKVAVAFPSAESPQATVVAVLAGCAKDLELAAVTLLQPGGVGAVLRTHRLLLQDAVTALTYFAWLLVATALVGRYLLSFVLALLPTWSVMWGVWLVGLAGAAAYMTLFELMTAPAAAGFATVITFLLVRGFE